MTRALRVAAVSIAVAGLLDPGVAVTRRDPVRVDIAAAASPSAREFLDRVLSRAGTDVVANKGETPDALLLSADARDPSIPATGIPVSVLMPTPTGAANIRVIDASAPQTVLVGQEAAVTAQFEAVRMAGQSSVIELQQDGVTLGSVEHRWTRERERFTASLEHVPPTAGLRAITIVARPVAGEASGTDNAVDLPLLVSARTLRVAVYEPRPSWSVSFVRRALESDPLFAVSTLTRPSRGPIVTVGRPLGALSADGLAAYDAVIAGAPDELSAAEVSALRVFCEGRGGAVILLPDRKPSGPYTSLVSASGFDEVLLDKPERLAGDAAVAISASELALVRRSVVGSTAVGLVPGPHPRPAIVSIPRGNGRVLFSGALDAWRYRSGSTEGDAFSRFWTGLVANLAAASPRPLSVTVEPAIAAPGERLLIRAAIDLSSRAVDVGGEGLAVGASLIAHDGQQQFVRLWPAAEPGVFVGDTIAPAVGLYDARVTAATATADTPVMVANRVRHPQPFGDDALRSIAAATGGVIVNSEDTMPFLAHLRGLPRRETVRKIHPMRSVWWSVPFAAALCAEWALRRRQGAR